MRRRNQIPRRRTAAERYEALIDRSAGPDACHPWMGSKGTKLAYGQFWNGTKAVSAHRFGWVLMFGPIPNDLHVLHRCDFPPCQNPRHWFLGTNDDNVADKMAKGRHDGPRGTAVPLAKLTEEQVRDIRRRWTPGHRYNGASNTASLAAEFGVSPSAILMVGRYQTWKHVH